MLPITLSEIVTDSTHERKGFFRWMKDFCGAFFRFNSLFRYVVVCVAGWFALYFTDRKRRMHKAVFFLFAILSAFIFSLTYLLMYRGQSYFVFSISILGFFAYLLYGKESPVQKKMFLCIYVPGVLYWACIDAGSNMSLLSITASSVINLPASLCFISAAFRELMTDWKKEN